MKRLFSRVTSVVAFTLLVASSMTANAACRPNSCWQNYQQCVYGGGDANECYFTYERCLYKHGCPVP